MIWGGGRGDRKSYFHFLNPEIFKAQKIGHCRPLNSFGKICSSTALTRSHIYSFLSESFVFVVVVSIGRKER